MGGLDSPTLVDRRTQALGGRDMGRSCPLGRDLWLPLVSGSFHLSERAAWCQTLHFLPQTHFLKAGVVKAFIYPFFPYSHGSRVQEQPPQSTPGEIICKPLSAHCQSILQTVICISLPGPIPLTSREN